VLGGKETTAYLYHRFLIISSHPGLSGNYMKRRFVSIRLILIWILPTGDRCVAKFILDADVIRLLWIDSKQLETIIERSP